MSCLSMCRYRKREGIMIYGEEINMTINIYLRRAIRNKMAKQM